jgi:hypothetical protein
MTIVINGAAIQALATAERNKVNLLLRRMRHLQARFEQPDFIRSWDLAEYQALAWALERIGVVLVEQSSKRTCGSCDGGRTRFCICGQARGFGEMSSCPARGGGPHSWTCPVCAGSGSITPLGATGE